MWMIAQNLVWQKAWEHYRAGGGVFVGAELNENEMTSALAAFRTAAKINPWNSKYRVYAGNALMELDRENEAIDEFDRAIAISSRALYAHYGKARALLKLQRYPEMVESLHSAVGLESRLNRVCRFSEDFATVRDQKFMQGFRDQY
jgi:tetratricopeptide (TPR) repeat protein